jgi:peptidoglycan/LPS O-acetylase OafA/YrhL
MLIRELLIIAGVLILIWLPTLPSTRLLNRVASAVAGASLFLYLTHFPIATRLPAILTSATAMPRAAASAVAVVLSFAAGLTVYRIARPIDRRLTEAWRRFRQRRSETTDIPTQRDASLI